MSFSSTFKRALSHACYGFCALTLLYSLVMIGVYDTKANMSVLVVLLFYPLCFTISFVNSLLQKSSMSGFATSLVRYATVLVSIGIFVLLPHKQALSKTSLLILFFAITILYAIGSLLFAWLASGKKKETANASEYVSVYKTTNKK